MANVAPVLVARAEDEAQLQSIFQLDDVTNDRLAAEQKKSGNPDAVVCGKAFIKGRPILLAVMDPTFMMGSMGSVVGEKLVELVEAFRPSAAVPVALVEKGDWGSGTSSRRSRRAAGPVPRDEWRVNTPPNLRQTLCETLADVIEQNVEKL